MPKSKDSSDIDFHNDKSDSTDNDTNSDETVKNNDLNSTTSSD